MRGCCLRHTVAAGSAKVLNMKTGRCVRHSRHSRIGAAAVEFVIVLPLLSVFNLYRARLTIQSPLVKRQFIHLLVATAITHLGALYSAFGAWLRPDIPTVPGYVLLAAGMIFLGYSVAKYRALVEGRTIERNALYSVFGTGILALFYLAIVLLLPQ